MNLLIIIVVAIMGMVIGTLIERNKKTELKISEIKILILEMENTMRKKKFLGLTSEEEFGYKSEIERLKAIINNTEI